MGHFDPLILLRSESGCHLGNLIFNDLEALQVESSAHFDHLIFTERGGVLQKNRSFQNDNSGGFVTAKIKLRKAELDFRGQPKFPLWGFGSERLGVTVKWYFPKWEAPLYRIEAAPMRNLTNFVKFLKEKCELSLYAGGSLSADRHCCNIWHLPGSVRTAPRSKRRYTFLAQRAF